MPFTCEALSIQDVRLIRPRRFEDERGYFVEIYNRKPFAALGIDNDFVQDNEALSTQPGTLRGLHFQQAPAPQAKLIHVLAGAIFDAVVDIREKSPTFGRWCGLSMSAEGGEMLFVPAGFAHGYCTLQPNTIVAYKVDGYYDKQAEAGIRWDDPGIAIDWPQVPGGYKISDKDAALPELTEAARPYRFHD